MKYSKSVTSSVSRDLRIIIDNLGCLLALQVNESTIAKFLDSKVLHGWWMWRGGSFYIFVN